MSIARYVVPIVLGIIPLTAMAAVSREIPPRPEFSRASDVTFWSSALVAETHFTAFEASFVNGGTLASGDVDGDGTADLVVGAGPGRNPEVKVFGLDGTLKQTFRAYPAWFKGGVRVATGDLDGDGKAEIITAPGPGIEPQVNIFHADGSQVIPGGVWVYVKGFLSGVHVAVGDLDGDGKPEIITTPGPGGGPDVRIWNANMQLVYQFFAYDASMHDGVTVTTVKTPTGNQIVTGVESWSAPLVRRFTLNGSLMKEFYGADPASRAGVSVAHWDMDGDGTDEIVTTQNGGTAPNLAVTDLLGSLYRQGQVLDAAYRGALSVAATSQGLAVMPVAPVVSDPTGDERNIEVSLSEQRLYAYEHGRLAKSFLVSTGVSRHSTPVMATKVLEKIPMKDYRWTYATNSPDNYDLKDVAWNLRIADHIYIHYAYWHNNFGHPMSHGCVNVGKADAQWIFNWAPVNVPVNVFSGTLAQKSASAKVALTP